MKQLMTRIRLLAVPAMLLLLALPASAGNYCNNAAPPCDPNDPKSACFRPPKKKPTCEPKECDKCAKSPCSVGSGAYETDAVDLEIRTTGFPIVVSRLYESAHTIDGETGHGWTSSLSARLYYAVFLRAAPSTYSKEADIRLPNGSVYRFVENANGTYSPPAGRFDTLVRNGDGTWDLWLQLSRSRYHFASTGALLSIIDDYGNTQSWTYVNDRLDRVEDISGSGRYIDVVYGGDGRISDVTDHTGRNIHYTYNGAGMMTAAENAASQDTSYSYVNGKYVPLLSAITDNWGRNITSITYDAQDRVLTYTERGETFTYTYAYNGAATTTAKSDSSGNLWQYPFGADGLVHTNHPPGGGGALNEIFDANGLIQQRTDAVGVKTYFTYNANGTVASMTEDYQGSTAVRWDYVYDSNFPTLAVSITPRNPSTNQIHPHWQAKKYDYYAPATTAPGALHHVYEVDDDGVTSRVLWTYTYDSGGRVLTQTDANSNVTSFAYDADGNLETVTAPANNDTGTPSVTTYTHDSLGRMTSKTDADGIVVLYTWDTLDRIATLTLPKPHPLSVVFTTTYHHDEFDSPTGTLYVRIVDPNGRERKRGYDQYGQLTRDLEVGGALTRFVYTKGLLTSKVDPNNNTTTFAYDTLRRLWTITHQDSTFERFTYHADNTLATSRNRSNETLSYTYDRFKRIATKVYPGGRTLTQSYNGQKAHQIVDSASANETTSFTWNASFRLTAHTQGNRGTVNFTYGTMGELSTRTVTSGATATYGYYPSGDVRTITWSLGGANVMYTYTLGGRTQSIALPSGQTRGYQYDGQGRITQIASTHSSTGNIATFQYGYDVDPFTSAALRGKRTTVTATVPALSLNNALSEYTYDAAYRLSRADYPNVAPYNGTSETWTYDAAGNRTAQTISGVTANYTYATYASNPLNAQMLLSDGGNTYTYDSSGSMQSRSGTRGNHTFTHNVDGRLATIGGDDTASFSYDFLGRRTARTVNGNTTTSLYDGHHVVRNSGASTVEYLYGPGADRILAMSVGGQIYDYAVDAIGSVIAVTDAAGVVKNSYAYDVWGAAKATNETVANAFHYTAREREVAGLQFNRSRDYEAASGSFRQVDSLIRTAQFGFAKGKISQPTALRDYQYADNNPATSTDPFGLLPPQTECLVNCRKQYDERLKACNENYADDRESCDEGLVECGLLNLFNEDSSCGLDYLECIKDAMDRQERCKQRAIEAREKCAKQCWCKYN